MPRSAWGEPKTSSQRRGAALSATALLLCALLVPRAARAQDEDDDVRDTPAWRANVGFHLTTGFAVLLPSGGDSVGVGLQAEGRYGFVLGPSVIAPGGELSGYYLSSRVIGTLMPTLRITLPLGPLAPFVRGGVGAGGLSNPGEGGLAWIAGGGLMIHASDAFSFGVEVSYEAITGTEFRGLSIAPTLTIGG